MFAAVRTRTERMIRRFRVPLCKSPFVVLFRERSGSSHLCSLLDSHPDVLCRQEDFDYRVKNAAAKEKSRFNGTDSGPGRVLHTLGSASIERPSRRDVVTHLYDVLSHHVTACGFKFKFPLQMEQYPEVIDELTSLGTRLHVIVLTRENVLKQSVSRQNMIRMQKTMGMHNLHSRVTPEQRNQLLINPCQIDVTQTVTYARQLFHQSQSFLQFANQFEQTTDGNSIRIDYDDLLFEHESTLKNTLRFLGVDANYRCTSYVEKATPNDLREAIANYGELAKAVAGSELERFLEH